GRGCETSSRSRLTSSQSFQKAPTITRRSPLEKPMMALVSNASVAPPLRISSSTLGIGPPRIVGQPKLVQVLVVGQDPHAARLGSHKEAPAALLRGQLLDRAWRQPDDALARDVGLRGAVGQP